MSQNIVVKHENVSSQAMGIEPPNNEPEVSESEADESDLDFSDVDAENIDMEDPEDTTLLNSLPSAKRNREEVANLIRAAKKLRTKTEQYKFMFAHMTEKISHICGKLYNKSQAHRHNLP
eukprot:TRINITY_DN4302_c0_g1_i1.p1 TRINITY_DN4302_c0_g1~~TRINITY_DN4302_c0_g1_i1.p1  ORF type:complete len:120 (-),score=20.93 TRINITY_DN4302_c0_g1_i1:181-540(-)